MRELYVPESNLPPEEECILVMNNFDRVPTSATICLFAQRLTEAQRSCDVNIRATRFPVLIPVDQKSYYTMKKMYEEYDGNAPVIYGDKNLISADSIKAIKTDAPFVANDIMEYKRLIWDEFLTTLGLNNLAEKRERLITSEVDSNNEVINMNMQAMLVPRKQACREFNEKFGLTGDRAIDVKLRSDLYNIIKENESIISAYDIEKKIEGENG